MFKFVLATLISFPVFADTCSPLFDRRGEGASVTLEAMGCYEESLRNVNDAETKSQYLVKISYLKFFQAENYTQRKESLLFEAMEIAEKGLEAFGPKYSLGDYRKLSASSQTLVAESLYNYGLIVARYVDEKGVVEALKRMDDIKKSMTTIIRLKQEAVAHFGAHRVLGIFHTKVPSIAGGDLKLAKTYLEAALEGSRYSGDLSRYPLNHVVYSDYLYKVGEKDRACAELRKVMDLSASDIKNLDNGLFHESMENVASARESFKERKCSR